MTRLSLIRVLFPFFAGDERVKGYFEIIPTDELASEAWLTKCRYGNLLSIVDCFVYALGKKEDALILTTDSAFKELDVKVEWFEVL